MQDTVDKEYILIPYKNMLSENIVLNLLTDAGLESSDFGEYYKYLQAMDKVGGLTGISVGDI